ncbi:hypothetical protein HU200_054648 [Digitaria exilis]|uniref:Major facilitator superfamily (MFS) profile domain-containing protein n=1 Tax=Digitaria exilis TaxID=1010633 RepID=A0A835AFF1_9POAL|nr:hypothetical protein HU200_054648 [Digitaria exilis]
MTDISSAIQALQEAELFRQRRGNTHVGKRKYHIAPSKVNPKRQRGQATGKGKQKEVEVLSDEETDDVAVLLAVAGVEAPTGPVYRYRRAAVRPNASPRHGRRRSPSLVPVSGKETARSSLSPWGVLAGLQMLARSSPPPPLQIFDLRALTCQESWALAMAGGAVVNAGAGKDYPGKLTMFVLFACIVAATGGLIFGYDVGISGGVTSMNPFLMKFFPSVYRKKQEAELNQSSQYCKFDSQLLTLFTSSLYLAAFVASFFAATVTRVAGRKWSMFGGGVTFLIGAALNSTAKDVAMLIVGRVLLGIGVGFNNQSVPVYLSEMAPARLRGMLNIGFQLMITIGILGANLINYPRSMAVGGGASASRSPPCRRPPSPSARCSSPTPPTPSSPRMLKRLRGTDDVDEEYNDMVAASEESKLVAHPWRNILQRRYRPQLVMAIAIPMFLQFTGINVIMFYAPVLFKTLGFGDDASLMSAIITGLVNVFATFVSIVTGGAQMLACRIGAKFGFTGVAEIPKAYAVVVVLFVCAYVAGFAWSWGPLGWLVPSEIFPLEIRSAGQSINVSVNMLCTFVIAQASLPMLCRFKFVMFFFFGAWLVAMTIFVALFLPETKNVPMEQIVLVWKSHWYWRRFIRDEDVHVGTDLEMHLDVAAHGVATHPTRSFFEF